MFVVHQTRQEEGPLILGGSCTFDPEGLMNGQVVGGFATNWASQNASVTRAIKLEWVVKNLHLYHQL